MLIDYQISESDYVHGERLVMRPHTERKDISKILGSSFAGLLLIIAAVLDLLRSGFTPINVLLVLSGLFFLLSIPLLRAFLSRGSDNTPELSIRIPTGCVGDYFLR